jgi:hypothetical protein
MTWIGVVVIGLLLASFGASIYLGIAVSREMDKRVPLHLRDIAASVENEIIWLPGVPVSIRRKHVASGFFMCIATFLLAAAVAVGAADRPTEPRGLSAVILVSAFASLQLAYVLSLVIRHRDKLK